MNNRPLEGVRIVDFGWILAVPHCTSWLGSLGAEIVRVESRNHLDLIRSRGMIAGADGIPGLERSPTFNGLNYSKKDVTLDLARPRAVELAKELVARSDVVTENFVAGVMENFGLDYEVLRKVKPDIIMLSGTPLGNTGPERMSTGWGANSSAYGGLPYITGYEGGPPAALGGAYPDFMVGVQMAFAIMVALHEHRRTGNGQYIDLSMSETSTAMTPEPLIDYSMNGREWERRGNRHPWMAPHAVYPCAGDDRWVAIAVDGDEQWCALRREMGDPEWAADACFEGVLGRLSNEERLNEGIAEWTRQHGHYEVMHRLQAAGIAASACLDVHDLHSDPQLAEREFVIEIDHPELGPRKMLGLPGRFSEMPRWAYTPSPLMGEHNREVLCGLLGLPEDEFTRLVDEQVIY